MTQWWRHSPSAKSVLSGRLRRATLNGLTFLWCIGIGWNVLLAWFQKDANRAATAAAEHVMRVVTMMEKDLTSMRVSLEEMDTRVRSLAPTLATQQQELLAQVDAVRAAFTKQTDLLMTPEMREHKAFVERLERVEHDLRAR